MKEELVEVPKDFGDADPSDSRVDVPSSWKSSLKTAGTKSVSTETKPLVYEMAATQTGGSNTTGTQTDDGSKASKAPPKVNASGMMEFVKKVESMMAGELHKAAEEHEVLEPFTRAAEDEQEPAVCIHYLSPFQQDMTQQDLNATSTQINKHRLVVTCISWSCTGQTVAASFGRYDVVGWCTYPGALTTWNLGREEVNTSRADHRIDTDTCLMSCAFHPAHPALIAGGTFNGEVYVWDLSQEGDPQRGRSDVLLDARHTEPVIAVTWQYNLSDAAKYGTKDKSYRLVTLGADGRVLTWMWHKLEAPVYGYQLLYPQPGIDRKFVWGGACMAFQREPRGVSQQSESKGNAAVHGGEMAGTFLVGTEGGKIFKCYNDVNDASQKDFAKQLEKAERVEMRTPVREANYTPHAGAVFGVDCSPFQRELFLSCSTDGSVRLYSSLRMQPLLHLEPTASYLFAVQFSPFRPMVFAAAGGDGFVYMYDLMRSQDVIRPVLTLDTNGMRKPVYAMAFNPRKHDVFATGDATGIQVWKLPSSLTSVRRGEEALLRKTAVADDVAEMLRKSHGK